jgi:hypothetical protein
MSDTEWFDKRRKARIDTYNEELEQAYEHYIAKVEAIAAKAREEVVIPFLKDRGWEFRQGNGTWLISDDSRIRYLPSGKRDHRSYADQMNDELPDWLDRCMRLYVEGAYGNPELALWMLDYTTRKTKNRS